METLVLPPEDQLVRRHYWHTNIKKTGGCHPLSVASSRYRRRSSASAFLHLSESLSDRSVVISNDLDGLLPIPGCSAPDSVVSNIPAPSAFKSVQPSDFAGHTGDSEVISRSLMRSEIEAGRRPCSSSGRNNMQLRKERSEIFAEITVGSLQERASFFGKPRSSLRTSKSLPEQFSMKSVSSNGLANGITSKQRKSSNTTGIDSTEKKVYRVKKTMKKNEADKRLPGSSVFQGHSPENAPVQVTILQRPDSKEEALRNFARFKGIPLSELCAKNGLLVPSNCKNVVSEVSPKLDLVPLEENGSFDPLISLSKQEGSDSVTSTPKQKKLSRRHSSFEKTVANGMMKDSDVLSLCHKIPNAMLRGVGTRMTASNIAHKFPSEMLPRGVTDVSGDEFSKLAALTAEVFAEKWAGPSYTASPPPSCLPIPKFRLPRQSPSMLEAGVSDLTEGLSVKASTSMYMERVPVLSKSSAQDAKYVEVDTELATRDLRRMLHLDF